MSWGLRTRVTWISAGVLALALAAGTAVLFWALEAQLTGALDDDLTTQARVTAEAVESWGRATIHRLGRRPGSAEVQSLLADPSQTQDLVDLFTPPRDLPNSALSMLLAADGTILRQSHEPNAVGPLPDAAFDAVRAGTIRKDTATLTDSEARDKAYRVATAPVTLGGRVEAFVQVWRPLAPVRATLQRVYATWALGITALLGGTVVLIGAALRSALGPVDGLIGQIRKISQTTLEVRVPVPDTQDEIHRLAETFNAMLGRLQRAFEGQTQLLHDLSHQLKTPLAILKGILETTLDAGRSRVEYREALESSLDEVGRMASIIEDLLQLAVLEAGQEVLRLETVDLGTFCRRWIDDVALLLEPKSLSVVVNGSGRWEVQADPSRLGQAWLNLLDNAIKYSPHKGIITLTLTESDDACTVSLRNEGPGIEPGSEEAIFQRFRRGEGGLPGHGLGLSIARRIVEHHGGQLTAHSSGGGAEFRLTLPRRVPEKSLISS